MNTTPSPTRAIHVEVRTIYGQPKVYPVCPKAEMFAAIAGTATLTARTLRLIEALGFEIISRANADWRAAA